MTGESSKFGISRMASKYLELTSDGRWLSNRQSIIILRDRITQLLERIDQNQAPDRLQNLNRLWTEFRKAGGGRGSIEEIKWARLLDDEFEAAYHDYAAWSQMFEALELDRKMVESQVKIAKELKAIMTSEDAYELTAKLLAAIIEAASEIIQDAPTKARFLKRIQYEFARIIGDRTTDQTDTGLGGSGSEVIDSVTSIVD